MRSTIALLFALGAQALGCSLLFDPGDATGPETTPTDAGAEEQAPAPTPTGFGSGRDGMLDVSTEMTLNAYGLLAQPVAAATTMMAVDGALAFQPGDLALIWQTTGLAKPVLGSTTPVSLDGTVGRYEIARVRTVAGANLLFEAPLESAYDAGTQVVRIPQYEDVTIRANGSVRATPWDGQRGGVVAFFARGRVLVEGKITAEGAGFRGGSTAVIASLTGCTFLEGTPRNGFAARGEGLYPAGFGMLGLDSPGGRGNYANGGGGGDCANSGGAGGGGSGAGGSGGHSADGQRPVGGIGGASVAFNPNRYFSMGGGGGAGQSDGNPPTTNGGVGGGVVFVRARALDVPGSIVASGLSGSGSPQDGAGGGGAGGAILVDANESIACTAAMRTVGGGGGNAPTNHGPGGGGGGGFVRLRAKTITCTAEVQGGVAGSLGATGAGAGAAGASQIVR